MVLSIITSLGRTITTRTAATTAVASRTYSAASVASFLATKTPQQQQQQQQQTHAHDAFAHSSQQHPRQHPRQQQHLRGHATTTIPVMSKINPAATSTTTTSSSTTFQKFNNGTASNDTTRSMSTASLSSPENQQQQQHVHHGFDFDFLVIGAGSGGIASARRAASYGAKVGVIEKGRLGGTCVNVGCVPKKVMYNAASIAESLYDMQHYGFTGYESGAIHFDWNFIRTNRQLYVKRLNDIYGKNMATSGVHRVTGTARLVGPNTVAVASAAGAGAGHSESETMYTAQHILIATGGYPTFPPGTGIVENSITSDGFFEELEELPNKAVVVGAGYIAVELAGILQALGTDTSLVLRKERVLRTFDVMLAETLEEEMQRQGIQIYRQTNGVEKIVNHNGLKTLYLRNGDIIEGVDTVLVATGRAPLVAPLNLAAIGVQQTETGHIVTNEYSETSVNGVYALGDVCGKVELTPMAIAAGRRLADRLFGPPEWKDAKVSYDNVPTVVFSHPPIGTIGLTEEEALVKYGEQHIKIYRSKFSNMFYGPWQVEAEDKPKTAMKLICAGPRELVVGLHVIGMGADEMLQGFGIAMKMGATKADFDSTIAIHPTAAEEFVTMFPWGLSNQTSGAVHSPLNGAAAAAPPDSVDLSSWQESNK